MEPAESAVTWLVSSLTGSIATAVAAIAVGVVGLRWLQGEAEWRRGVQVVLGCALVFGAGAIASAVTQFRDQFSARDEPNYPSVVVTAVPVKPAPVDPYAGAAYFPASQPK